uniref:Kelch-like protein diablo n=1 Tax=Timema tahoe TaxID=61484 RepID=A0A7R9IAA7_9NEOP|nr:unnamed protein product [Timema tahoe]
MVCGRQLENFSDRCPFSYLIKINAYVIIAQYMDFTMKLRKLSKSRLNRPSPSSSKAKLNNKKVASKPKRCVCLPKDFAVTEFPRVWNDLRLQQQLCDGFIHTGENKTFCIHRAILSAASSYFKTLFTNALHKGQPEIYELTIQLPNHIVECILDYAYTGRCNITSDNVQMLLPAADQYEIVGIIQQCCQFLLEELRPSNCLGILRFAHHYFCRELENKGRRYVLYNFKKILRESLEFKDLLPEELEIILKDDELNIRNEETVFEAIMQWVEADAEGRKHNLGSLIHCARYGLMSFKFFTDVVMNNRHIQASPELQQMLYSASVFLVELDSKLSSDIDLNDPIARPRIPYEILFAVGGWSAGSPTNFVETYDTRSDRWFLSMNTDATPRAYHGLCMLDKLIYMIGGFDGNKHFNSVRCYNPISKEWKERACMYNARCYVSVCTLGGKIYALGGYNGRVRMSSAERYTPRYNQWEIIPSMHKQRSDASAAVLQNKIYIVGGFNGTEVLSSVEVFDPVPQQWTFIHSMSSARSGVSLISHKDCLYALGGFNGVTRLNTGNFIFAGERYDPNQSPSWREIAEMFSPRSNFATAVLDEMIFVIGQTTIAYVECYDVVSNEWYDASPMNLNRSALNACVLTGLSNAKDYSYLSKVHEIGQGGSSDCPNN